MKIKKLCGVSKKDIEQNLEDLLPVLKKPKYVCTQCCRTAKAKKNLCKPLKLED